MRSGTLEAIGEETAALTRAFVDAGHRIFLVGGIVRDLMLRHEVSDDHDLDFTTDATPSQIKSLIGPLVDALWLQGERFGTIGARIGGREYEITTHRSEVYPAESRKPVVAFSTAIDEDLSRRDFTVNAMAIELPQLDLVDPFGGRDDLESGVLRTPLDPEVSFTDDPLRMMRAARFVAGYGLAPAGALVAAMTELRTRLDIVSVERVRDELDKLLRSPDPGPGLDLLESTGLLERFLPEAVALGRDDRNRSLHALPADPALRLAALLHEVDIDTARARLRTLRHSNERTVRTTGLLRAVAQLVDGAVTDEPAFRRWVAKVGDHRDQARELALAVSVDSASAVARSRDLEVELADELDDLEPALTGEEIMDLLGLGSGPDVGRAVAFLQELRYDEGPSSPEEERARLERWWRNEGGAAPTR